MTPERSFALRRAFLRFARTPAYDEILDVLVARRRWLLYAASGLLAVAGALVFHEFYAKADEPVASLLRAAQVGLSVFVILWSLAIMLGWVRCVMRWSEQKAFERFARSWRDAHGP
jgi:hypothetical protein